MCQLTLPQELCFSYIGVAAAIGQAINIPVIIRSLGHDLYRVGFNPDTNFQAGLDFLTYLDGNLSGDGPDDPNLQVTEFHLAWWTQSSAPQKYIEYLSFMTIRDALEVHRIQLEKIPKRTPGSAPRPSHFQFTKPGYIWHPAVKSAEGPDCNRCRLYRAVSHGTVTPLRDIRNMVHGCQVASEAERDVGIRRASIMNSIFEAVLQKEGPPDQLGPDASKSSRGASKAKKQKQKRREMIDLTQAQAAKELVQQTEVIDLTVDAVMDSPSGSGMLPGSSEPDPELTTNTMSPLESLKMTIKDIVIDVIGASKKWTWGVELTKEDLEGMVRGIDRVGHVHSGYDSELHTGSLLSTVSQYMDPDTIEDIHDLDLKFDAMSADVASVRSLEPHEFPVAFTFPPLHHLSACDTDSEPDSVIKAFIKKAVWTKGKRQLQEEIEGDSDIYSDEAPTSPIPSFPDHLIQKLHAPGLAVPGLAALRLAVPQSPECPVHIVSDDSSLAEHEMDVSMSEDEMQMLPVGDLGASSDNFLGPGPGIPMVVIAADSDSDHNPTSEESGRPVTTFIVPQFDEESPLRIPTAIEVSDSDSEDDDVHQQSGLVIPAGSGVSRDPLTGLYTAASFAHFQDDWV